MPANDVSYSISGIFLGEISTILFLIVWIYSGVVPQQPPTIFKCPSLAKLYIYSAINSGESSYSPNSFGSPALG